MGFRNIILLSLLFVFGCTVPIDLKVGLTEPKVVVDGYISDIFKAQKIELSYSSTFFESGNNIFIPLPIRNAIVSVEDDSDNVYVFEHTADGIYLSQPFMAEFGALYKIKVDVAGKIFQSTFETLPEQTNQQNVLDIAMITKQVEEDGDIITETGVLAFATMVKTANEDHFLWAVNHHFSVQTLASLCYAKEFDLNQVIELKDTETSTNVGSEYRVDLSFKIPDYKTNLDFVIDATLLTISEPAYNYWRTIKEQIERTGGLFDPNGNTIRGNLINTNGSEGVLGYFGVYRESVNYYFFNQTDLPIEQDVFACPGVCFTCQSVSAESSTEVKPIWWR